MNDIYFIVALAVAISFFWPIWRVAHNRVLGVVERAAREHHEFAARHPFRFDADQAAKAIRQRTQEKLKRKANGKRLHT